MSRFYIGIILALITGMHTAHMSASKVNEKNIFSHKKDSSLYWEALRRAFKKDKEVALKIVEALRQGISIDMHLPWEDTQPQSIDAFFDKLFLASVARDPEALTQLSLFESIGIHEHNAHLTDISIEAAYQALEEKREYLHRLNQYQVDDLLPEHKVSHKIFSWMLNHTLAEEKFLFHTHKVTQMTGLLQQISVVFTQFHKLETAQDAQHYILRLNKIPRQFDQVLQFLALQKAKGILPPRFVVEKVIPMIQRMLPERIDENILYAHLAQKLHGIQVEDADVLLAAAKEALEMHVYPAYHRLREYFEQLRTENLANNGVWALPDGDAYYAYMLKHHTTTDLAADEIYVLGLQEVGRIHAEMRQILAAEGMDDPHKTVGVIIQELSENPQFYYSNTDEGRQRCLAEYHAILERSRKELGPLFGLKPKSGVQVQRVPVHEEEGAPGAYYWEPSADGSRPGVFFANLRDMAEVPTYGMETLTIHEAEPGHHFQIALQMEMDIPMLRKLGGYTAYIEGWALYTEKLAYEQGFYSSSFSKLGHLRDELLRAARLVIDTGIHHRRWSREQAIAYMEEVTGLHHNSVVTEVERYFVLPGQACSYKIGQLKILELRKRAKEKLGEKFSIQEFHDVLLGIAAVPLMVLEEVVEQYIQDKLAAA